MSIPFMFEEVMDDFRSVRIEALVLLGGYDIDASPEELRAKLDRFYESRNMPRRDPKTP